MERTRRDSVCFSTSHDCESTLTRFVWAGDQLLWEMRVPGGNDVPTGSTGLDATSASGEFYGRVSYFHAGGIDKPLLITKEGVESVVPRETWRGQFHAGTSPTTGARRDCPVGTQTGCLQIAWPGMQTNAAHSWGGEQPDIRVWYGGLVDGMRDASGQMYMRNRYYDPATGQFTQTDPIGLAGGLNAYGFAAGDPVSYSDPYGLNPCKSLGKAAAFAAVAAGSDLVFPVGDVIGVGCLAAAVLTAAVALATTADAVSDLSVERRREPSRVYHRKVGPVETAQVLESGEVWGRPPRNFVNSDIPKVQAFNGPLPPGASGYEFVTDVAPDRNSPPWLASWSGDRAGVQTEDGWAKIKVQVTKVQP